MQYIGKSKIGKLSAKKGKIYAQIRLPSQLAYTIGEIADIFETERNGKRAFLLVTKQSVLDNDIVLQPKQKVVKPDDETEYNRRFKALESEINKLKSLLLLNQHQILHENQKGDEPEWARPDRTGDLRHVKAGNSAFLVAFSNFFLSLSARSCRGIITYRTDAPWCTQSIPRLIQATRNRPSTTSSRLISAQYRWKSE